MDIHVCGSFEAATRSRRSLEQNAQKEWHFSFKATISTYVLLAGNRRECHAWDFKSLTGEL
jgi:hypothetical protein